MLSSKIKRSRILLWAATLFVGAATAKPSLFYVATNGNDQWSGRLAQPAANGKDGPLPSISAAISAARRDGSTNGKTLLVRGGVYELGAPLAIGPEDSGIDPQHPFTIEAYPGEKPVLSGGRRIGGWKRAAGNAHLWQTEISDVRDGRWYFRQFFTNGERRQRARTPNDGFFRIAGPSPQGRPAKMKFNGDQIKREWADDGDVELVALVAWTDLHLQIRAVDETNRTVTLAGNPHPAIKEDNAQFFIENTADALDQPGEWYLNRKTAVLTYWPKAGEDLTKLEATAPFLQELMLLKGNVAAKKPVHDVALRGLTFSYTDWPLGPDGHTDAQAAINSRGNLLAEAARDCAIEDCNFSHLGGYGIELGRGCQRIRVVGNEMMDLASGGIRIGETTIRREPFEQNEGQIVTDNHLHHLGQIHPSAVGVLVLQSGRNRIAHNHIHDLYYTAVSVGWTWGYSESPCRGNLIEYNHMHHVGLGRLSDMGAVYTLGPQPGTVVRNNLIHDVDAFTYGGWGLYTDEGSTGIILESNVVFRCKSASFHQHYGKENIVRNNILAFGREHQLMRTRPEPHISFFFTNNIVYYGAGDLLGSDWSNDHYVMEGNLYFDTRHRDDRQAIKFASGSLEAWRGRGHDTNSILADPLFSAPEKDDFRLLEGSPAFKLGFKSIDLSEVGIRERSKRK